jgi:hypothetical protein
MESKHDFNITTSLVSTEWDNKCIPNLFAAWEILSANKAGKQHYYWNLLIGFHLFSIQTGFEPKK